MFEKATRMKLRFNFRGLCSVEDLWDAPSVELDRIYRDLKKVASQNEGDGLLSNSGGSDSLNTVLTLKMDIVKHIFTVRKKEADDAGKRVERADKKRKIMEIIEDKQNENLRNMPLDELTKMVDEL